MWLRPDSRLALGRIRPKQKSPEEKDGLFVKVADKSVSRVHLIINVAPVEERDGIKVHTRSRITLQDRKTVHGSIVNNVVVKERDYVLPSGVDEFKILMGKYDVPFW